MKTKIPDQFLETLRWGKIMDDHLLLHCLFVFFLDPLILYLYCAGMEEFDTSIWLKIFRGPRDAAAPMVSLASFTFT